MSDTIPKKQDLVFPRDARGPLVVSKANPRYFTVASARASEQKAIYLTGSHGGGHVDQTFAEVLGLSDVPSWGDSTAWQYGVIEFVKRYEQQMEPRSDLSSTGYALANPGEEYLVLHPNEAADPFTVIVEAGAYTVEWFDITRRQTGVDGEISVERSGTISFTPQGRLTGPVVLYLKRRER